MENKDLLFNIIIINGTSFVHTLNILKSITHEIMMVLSSDSLKLLYKDKDIFTEINIDLTQSRDYIYHYEDDQHGILFNINSILFQLNDSSAIYNNHHLEKFSIHLSVTKTKQELKIERIPIVLS